MRTFASIAATAALLSVPAFASAQTAAELQAQIQALLANISQLQQQIGGTAQGSVAPTQQTAGCPQIGRALRIGSTGAEVSRLQQFLARDPSIYPEGNVTGYYGRLTEAAVKRWQAKFNIVSTGDASTTGFGVVGPRTAAAMALQCSVSGGGGGTGVGPTVGGFIQVTPVSGTAPLSVTVLANVNTTKSCTGAVYTLDFGDASTPESIPVPPGSCSQMQQSFTHNFVYGGTYQIKLSAGGHQTTATVSVSGPSAPQKPNFPFTPGLPAETFTATPQTGDAPLSVLFSGVVTSNDAGFCPGGCSAALDFGDGKVAAITLPATVGGWLNYSLQHTYTTPGGYRATLFQGPAAPQQPIVGSVTIVVAQGNGTSTTTPPTGYTYGALAVTPNAGGNPLAISAQFDLPSSCTGYRISWGDASTDQFQTDGGTQCAQSPSSKTLTHTYQRGGSFVVTLKRGASLSQTDTAAITISQ